MVFTWFGNEGGGNNSKGHFLLNYKCWSHNKFFKSVPPAARSPEPSAGSIRHSVGPLVLLQGHIHKPQPKTPFLESIILVIYKFMQIPLVELELLAGL